MLSNTMKISLLLRARDLASSQIAAVSRGVGRLGAAIDEAGRKVRPLQDKLKSLGDTGERMQKAMLPGAAIVAGLAGTVAVFANLEEAQARLKTTLMDATGAVGPEFAKLNNMANELGTSLPGSTKDMIEMFIALREQGVQSKVILGGAGEAAAKLAALMKLSFPDAATHVAKFSESMGVADKDMVRFMDLLQRLKYASGVEMGELAYTFKYAGGSLKLLGQQGLESAKDFSAVVGVLAAAGIEGGPAGSNMAQALSRMAEIGHRLDRGAVKKLVAPVLDKYGIELKFFSAKGEFTGMRGMVKELEKLKALNPQEQIIVLKKLFGDEAARPMAILMKSGVEGFDAMTRRMAEQADMQQKIKTIMAGTKTQWETMTGTLSNVIAKIGGVTAGVLNVPAVLGKINAALGRIDSWIAAHPAAAKWIMGSVAATGALLLVIGGLGVALSMAAATTSFAIGGWVRVGTVLKTLGTIMRETALASRLLEIVNSGAPLRALVWHYNQVKGSVLANIASVNSLLKAQLVSTRATWLNVAALRAKGLTLITSVRNGLVTAIADTRLWIATQYASSRASWMSISGLRALSVSFATSFVGGVKAAMVAMRLFTVSLLTNPIGWIALAIAAAAMLIYKYWKPISGFFKGLWQGLKEGLKGLEPAWNVFRGVGAVLRPVLAPLKWIWNAVAALLKPVDDVGGAAHGMGVRFGRAIGGILSAVLTMPHKMFQAGANIIKSLWDGMKSLINKPVEAMKGMAQKLRNLLPFSPAKDGPLRDIHRIRLVETIASSMTPGPMVKAMRTVTAATMLAAVVPAGPGLTSQAAMMTTAKPTGATSSSITGKASTQITFAPVINLASGTPAEVRQQVDQALRLSQTEFERMLARAEQNRQRKGFV